MSNSRTFLGQIRHSVRSGFKATGRIVYDMGPFILIPPSILIFGSIIWSQVDGGRAWTRTLWASHHYQSGEHAECDASMDQMNQNNGVTSTTWVTCIVLHPGLGGYLGYEAMYQNPSTNTPVRGQFSVRDMKRQ